MTARDLLRLARLHGIAAAYSDGLGTRRQASAEVLEGLLDGLGVDTSNPADAWRVGLRERWSELCEPVAVAWDGAGQLLVRAPASARGRLRIEVECEDGVVRARSVALAEAPIAERFESGTSSRVARRVPLPDALPPGYHRATVRLRSQSASALVIAAPRRAPTPARGSREFGVVAPLYSLRSQHGHGIADLGDLRRLLKWTGERGGGFAGTLPLLAAFLDAPAEVSPYLPASRLAWNELYLELPSTPEWQRAPEARALLESSAARRERRRLSRTTLADPAAAFALKRPALEVLARRLFAGRGGRRAALDRFATERPEIVEYARFRAAGERLGRSWQRWPARARGGRLRDADVPREAYRYHLYAQFAMHEQLAERSEQESAIGPGLYLDLPLGAHAAGFDTWRDGGAFALPLGAGAPPDRLFAGGQSWGLPPLHPEGLRRQGYRHLIEVLRNHLRYAGVLRLDHVMGVERLYVIPPGGSARDGAYLHYRAEELWAILALEAARAGSRLVGEDLGTVTRSVRAAMRRHGVGRMHVLEFAVRPSDAPAVEAPPPGALATLSTHDLPPLAGWAVGRDIEERRRLGFLDAGGAAEDLVARRRDVRALRRALGVPRTGDERELILAGLRHLGQSDAPLVAVALDDLVGASDAQNLPGTVDEHPNWRRRTERRRDTLGSTRVIEAVGTLAAAREQARRRVMP
jgi:4-alpha-glucanotransferase